MKKLITHSIKLALVFIFNQTATAQNEYSNWYFGNNAGITFNSGSPVALTDGALATHEGSSSISDPAGNLLFYTDGITVYNSLHVAMPNGFGLMANQSSTQAALIIPMPGNSNMYYIFTIDLVSGNDGLRYSLVDMTLDGGLGNVTSKNVLVYNSAKEKLTAAKHANGSDYWIIINSWVSDDIRAFHLSSTGIDTVNVAISNIGVLHGGTPAATAGYIKASSQNDKLAMGILYDDFFVVVDFDNSTGLADSSSRITLGSSATFTNPYGVEFSPDGTKLYGTTIGSPRLTLQFDLSSDNDSIIFATRDTLEYVPTSTCGGGNFYFGALQIGPDGKIYGVNPCDSTLNVINYPDSLGSACGYVARAVSLSGMTCDLGLPNYIASNVLFSGIESLTNSMINFNIYPNPASDYLTISISGINSSDKTSVAIFDVTGNEIQKGIIAGTSAKIDISKLTSGLYILSINNGTRSGHKKFIVN